ncbi:TatD family hydrolase [Robiginitomaculum antarcticum]|uniref:TatD family hydrolase n=1 Tax=Robiginitomaculum antarcticum TaxID=437507 RepID=UPI00037BA61E|nr:TatD family hydrolase [Robiginitomaculum antarcticum]
MWVDSHVNLHGEKFAEDLPEVIAKARHADVRTMLTICCKLSEFDQVLAVAQSHKDIYCSVGTHPHEAKDNPDIMAADLLAHIHHPEVIGIGETGLDFHYNYSDEDVQYANFRAHISASRESQLPLIIHSRNADAQMAQILEEEHDKGVFPHLLHCYTGGAELARRSAALGGYISLSGILTFNSAKDIRALVPGLPEDRILIETDCPYLAPMPYRGRRCEPHMVVETGKKLAEIKGWSLAETQARTTDAFFRLFSKAQRPAKASHE